MHVMKTAAVLAFLITAFAVPSQTQAVIEYGAAATATSAGTTSIIGQGLNRIGERLAPRVDNPETRAKAIGRNGAVASRSTTATAPPHVAHQGSTPALAVQGAVLQRSDKQPREYKSSLSISFER